MNQKKQWLINGIILIIVGFFIYFQLNALNETNDEENLTKEDLFNEIDQQVETNAKYPEKMELISKMYNPSQFQTLKCSYEVIDNNYGVEKYQFAIDVINEKSMIQTDSYTIILDAKKKTKTDFYEKEKKFGVYPLIESNESEEDTSDLFEEILQISDSLESYISTAGLNIVRSEFIQFLVDFENWSVEETEFLNRKSSRLTGTIDRTQSENLYGNFEWVVDQETGVTLDLKVFDEAGEVKYHIQTIEIEFNEPVDPSIFEKDPTGYTEIESMKNPYSDDQQ